MIDQTQVHLVEIVLSLAGALILILLGIIGFWIQKWIRSTDALTEAITNLKILFASTQTTVQSLETNCNRRCLLIDETMKSFSDQLHIQDTAIKLLQQYNDL